MQWMLPAPTEENQLAAAAKRRLYAGGKYKVALTDVNRIGDYVARIIEDPRTLNKYVFIWEDEKTQKEALEIAARAGIEIDTAKNSVRLCTVMSARRQRSDIRVDLRSRDGATNRREQTSGRCRRPNRDVQPRRAGIYV
jgi:hypothetical protein